MNDQARTLPSDSPSLLDGATEAEALAALLKAAGDPLRLQILRVFNSNAFGALELSEIFAMRQNAMSHHLKLLSRAGLISARREGTHLFYHRNSQHDKHRSLIDGIFAAVNSLALPEDIQQRLDNIQDSRAAASKVFFQRNADKFRQQQDLIASFPQYGEAVLAVLDIFPGSRGSVLEVGPGQGDLLKGLRERYQNVAALDNAEEMLTLARNTADREQLAGIEFILGDTASSLLAARCFDAITLNMVLHHTPVPARIIGDLAEHLGDHGVLVITELCQHDQDWVREACGDLWLGFYPEDLTSWATDAGLREAGSEYLALKNGFSIQIKQFTRAPTAPGDTSKGALSQ
jgi:ubiquinone/menaquinone biosynthesis C-methylase UbiE/DNA-binding transcriptional ArsR family regulator